MGMKMKNSEYTMIESAKDIIDWCERDKRTFLLHRIRTKLAFLLYKTVFFHFKKSYLETIPRCLKFNRKNKIRRKKT
jgi:hypothetical protein